jgi:hypothetical protein
MNKLIGLALAALLFTALPFGEALGRGFGGFRGGGSGGGGFGGGDFRGFGGGGFDRGDFGGFRGGGFDGGGFRDRNFGESRDVDTRGFQSERAQTFQHQSDQRPLREDSGPATGYGDRAFRGSAGASRTQLDHFLGFPTDAGVGHVAPARTGGAFEGTRVTAGRVEGPRGGSAAYISGTHVGSVSPDVRRSQGWAVRNAFSGHNVFSPSWYAAHGTAWTAAGIAATAWSPASWAGAADWVGCNSTPEEYDYGSTVLYRGGNVYVEGQSAGSEAQYYDQATSLAASGDAQQGDQADWLSLGVFGLVQGQQTDPTMIFQLAVNQQGIVRGNFYNTVTDTTLPVHGAVDKKTQRVAWTMGNNKNTVIDTGLVNLTKDEAPVLMHFGKDRTQQWLMVRLKSQADQTSGS